MKKHNNTHNEAILDRDDSLELEGTVEEALPSTLFRVRVSEQHIVLATLAGRLRQNRIRILPGDRVQLSVSPYDLSRGRITYRM